MDIMSKKSTLIPKIKTFLKKSKPKKIKLKKAAISMIMLQFMVVFPVQESMISLLKDQYIKRLKIKK